MKNPLVFVLLLLVTGIAAQEHNQANWQVGYFGDNIFHPGLKIGYEAALTNWIREKKNRTKYKSFILGTEFLYYHVDNHHHGFVLGPNLSYKRIKDNGKFIQYKWLLGIHRSFVAGSTYEVQSTGEVKKRSLVGQNMAYNSLSIRFGKSVSRYISYYGEFGLNARYPYNHSLLTGLHFGAGIQYSINKK